MRVRLEIEVLEIFGACTAADMGNMARIADVLGTLCPCMRDQKERSGLLKDHFSGFFGGPEATFYSAIKIDEHFSSTDR